MNLDEIFGLSPQVKLNPPILNLPCGFIPLKADLVEKDSRLMQSRVFFWSGLRVSEMKTTECCFYERCETKQGARRAGGLRRR